MKAGEHRNESYRKFNGTEENMIPRLIYRKRQKYFLKR